MNRSSHSGSAAPRGRHLPLRQETFGQKYNLPPNFRDFTALRSASSCRFLHRSRNVFSHITRAQLDDGAQNKLEAGPQKEPHPCAAKGLSLWCTSTLPNSPQGLLCRPAHRRSAHRRSPLPCLLPRHSEVPECSRQRLPLARRSTASQLLRRQGLQRLHPRRRPTESPLRPADHRSHRFLRFPTRHRSRHQASSRRRTSTS